VPGSSWQLAQPAMSGNDGAARPKALDCYGSPGQGLQYKAWQVRAPLLQSGAIEESNALSISPSASLLPMAMLLWTLTGAVQASDAQSGGTPAFESAEASLELSRSERRRIQRGLAAEGFDPGPADGLFGRGTRGAIRKWQESRGEAATGYLDADAARALLAAGEQRSRSAKSGGTDPSNDILHDKYILGLSRALKADDYPKALEFIDKLEKIGGVLPPSVEYFRGEAYFHTKRYVEANRALNLYVTKTGKKGRYYQKSLELMLAADEKITLRYAIENNYFDIVIRLLDRGVGINKRVANKGQDAAVTPLHVAILHRRVEIARLLIERGADVNARDLDGFPPLQQALTQVDIVKLLIAHGARLNALSRNDYGRKMTPLGHAKYRKQHDVVRLLRRHGAKE